MATDSVRVFQEHKQVKIGCLEDIRDIRCERGTVEGGTSENLDICMSYVTQQLLISKMDS
jgi:hypothetical protein